MNFSSKNPKDFPVDVPLVKNILIRLMTRNEADKSKAFTDRLSLMKNFESVNMSPEAHLAAIMGMMEKMTIAGKEPVFETGLVFGVVLTLAARSANGKMMLKKMLIDIERQQDGQLTDEEKAEQFKNLVDAVPEDLLTPEVNENTDVDLPVGYEEKQGE